MSNKSLTYDIKRVWELAGPPTDEATRHQLAVVLHRLAQKEDCDLYNLPQDMIREAGCDHCGDLVEVFACRWCGREDPKQTKDKND